MEKIVSKVKENIKRLSIWIWNQTCLRERTYVCKTVSSVNIYAQLRKLKKLSYISLASFSFPDATENIFAMGKEYQRSPSVKRNIWMRQVWLAWIYW